MKIAKYEKRQSQEHVSLSWPIACQYQIRQMASTIISVSDNEGEQFGLLLLQYNY
jgi:hypothetical protein